MTTPHPDRQAKIKAAAPKPPAGPSKILIGAVVALVSIIVVVAGALIANRSGEATQSAGGSAIPTGASGMGVGIVSVQRVDPALPVVDVYEDFQCPFCGLLERSAGSEIHELEVQGKIVLRYNVLTFLDQNLRNDSSNRSANAAMCAADAGLFEQYHDAIFAAQPAKEGQGYTDAQFRSFAEQVGLTGDALTSWQTCYDQRAHNQYIESVQEQAAKVGVNGTPTLTVNGKTVDLTGLDLQNLQAGQISARILAAAQ